MTPDEQEALSHKYWAHFILRLSSGKYAVWNVKRELVGIFDDITDLDLSMEASLAVVPNQIVRPKPSSDDLLKELGL